MKKALNKVKLLNLTEILNNRVLISIKDYETIYHAQKIPEDFEFFQKDLSFFRSSYTADGYPVYETIKYNKAVQKIQ